MPHSNQEGVPMKKAQYERRENKKSRQPCMLSIIDLVPESKAMTKQDGRRPKSEEAATELRCPERQQSEKLKEPRGSVF